MSENPIQFCACIQSKLDYIRIVEMQCNGFACCYFLIKTNERKKRLTRYRGRFSCGDSFGQPSSSSIVSEPFIWNNRRAGYRINLFPSFHTNASVHDINSKPRPLVYWGRPRSLLNITSQTYAHTRSGTKWRKSPPIRCRPSPAQPSPV